MKSFLFKVTLFSVFIMAISIVSDKIITSGLQKTEIGIFDVWNDIKSSKINAEVIINGNSKAVGSFSTKIIDSTLITDSYNIGIYGYYIQMQEARYNYFRKFNTKPKVLIQQISNLSLTKRDDLYNSMYFLPYLDDSIIRITTKKYIGLDFFDYNFPLLRYKGEYKIAGIGILEFFNLHHFESNKYHGYKPYDGHWNQEFASFKQNFPKGLRINVSEESVLALRRIIESCKRDSVQIILVYPPVYYEAETYFHNLDSVKQIYREVANNYNIHYLDYSNDLICFDTLNFWNSQHLNKIGSEKFSKVFVHDFKALHLLHE